MKIILKVNSQNQYAKFNGQQFEVKDILQNGVGVLGMNEQYPNNQTDFCWNEVEIVDLEQELTFGSLQKMNNLQKYIDEVGLFKDVDYPNPLKDLLEFFDEVEMDIENHNINIEEFMFTTGYDLNQIIVLCCNLEDDDIMSDIVSGNYHSLDHGDRTQFNDGYWQIVEELFGLEEDWEEGDDEEY